MNTFAIAIEKMETTQLFLKKGTPAAESRSFVSGKLIITEEKHLRFGIRIHQDGEWQAMVEIFGEFLTKDFNEEDEEQVVSARQMGFAYLFPYARSALSSLFASANLPAPFFPFILVDEVFGNVKLEKEKTR